MLVTVGRGYRLRLDAEQLDAIRFEELAGRGRPARGRRRRRRATDAARRRLGVWRGDAYAGVRRRRGRAPRRPRRLEELRLARWRTGSTPTWPPASRASWSRELEALVRDAPVPRAPVGPADAGPVPLGAPARRPGRLPAGPPAAGRRVGHRARARAAPAGGGRSSPRTRRWTCSPAAPAAGPGRLPAALCDAVGPAFVGRERRAGVAAGRRGRTPADGRRRLRLGPGTRGHRQDPPGRRAGPRGPRRGRGGAVRPVRPRPPGRPGAARPGAAERRRFARPRSTAAGDAGDDLADGGRPLPADLGAGPPGAARARRPAPGRRRDPRGRRRPRRVVPGRADAGRRRVPQRRRPADRDRGDADGAASQLVLGPLADEAVAAHLRALRPRRLDGRGRRAGSAS